MVNCNIRGIVYWGGQELRKEMWKMSWWTMFFGLTEPFFVPEYWFPPSLFDLAKKTPKLAHHE